MTNLKRRMQHNRLQGLCAKIVNDIVNNTVKLKERILSDFRYRCDFRCVLKIVNVRDRHMLKQKNKVTTQKLPESTELR